MNIEQSGFICPETHGKLYVHNEDGHRFLSTKSGIKYEFKEGYPDLTYPKALEEKVKSIRTHFNTTAEDYNKYFYQTFKTHYEDENETRNKFIDKLNITNNSNVLEIACGTGNDTMLIANRIGKNGHLTLLDLSVSMLNICKEKISNIDIKKEFCLGNANYLPFEDNYFDAVYCFTAVQYFDMRKSLAEMARVTKVGGKVVFGDHSLGPWLRDTYYGKVLAENPGVLAELPVKEIPVSARNVTVRWVIGSIFYLIDFEVGEGEPKGDFDYEVEGGMRGGTLRTRYEGKLEGVTKKAKELAIKAAQAKGLTIHKWLDLRVKEAAKKDLNL